MIFHLASNCLWALLENGFLLLHDMTMFLFKKNLMMYLLPSDRPATSLAGACKVVGGLWLLSNG